MAKEAVRGGAPPPQEQSDWTAAVGVSKLVPLKTNNTALDLSLFFALQLTCSLADEPEASASSGHAGSPPLPSG